ncbi:hypothetical protein RN001_009984 [Aquatica leii]|uniref:THAP-type domain-containing protein n=1 Tax=Aquatica leii TaxID=1421715 RepID=A0AAN7P7B5_9COLE|nr:hypothetical protein RN001_009984 [Aquatica leii]
MAPSNIYCSYFNCNRNKRENTDMSFFRFPLDKDKCDKWLNSCGNLNLVSLDSAQLRRKTICAVHFSNCNFKNSLKNSLVHDAVPAHYSSNDKNVFFETHEDKTPEKLTLTRECNPRVYENKMLLSNQSSVVDSNYDIENSPTLPISYGLQLVYLKTKKALPASYLTALVYRVSH